MERREDPRLVDAARSGTLDLVRCMLEDGVAVDSRNANGETALHLACFCNRPDVLKLLLDAGASVNAVTRSHFTPLHYAADSGNLTGHGLQLLVLAGADVTARDSEGHTPVHTSARMGRFSTFKFLAEEGARVSIMGLSGCGSVCSDVTANSEGGESLLSLIERKYRGKEIHVWTNHLHEKMKGTLNSLLGKFRFNFVWCKGSCMFTTLPVFPSICPNDLSLSRPSVWKKNCKETVQTDEWCTD